MCATFRLSVTESEEIKKILQDVKNKQNGQLSFDYTQKLNIDFYPKNIVPIAKLKGSVMDYELCKWGFPINNSSQVIFNARSETALEKSLFSDCLINRRCLIPVTGFYEWSHNKNKTRHLFSLPNIDYFYLGGFYKLINNIERFVIMTSQANVSMQDIHSRMPIILQPKHALQYLKNNEFAINYSMSTQPVLSNKVLN